MKYCEAYAALLDLYVDGELPLEELERVQAHLGTCPGCQAYVDDAMAIRAGFADIEDTPVPEGFAEAVMERIRRDGERAAKVVELKRRSARRWTGTLAALAACCALVILIRGGPGDMSSGAAMDTSETSAASVEQAPAAYSMPEGQGTPIEPQAAPEAPAEEELSIESEEDTQVWTTGKRETAVSDFAVEDTKEYGDMVRTSPAAPAPQSVMGDAQCAEAALYLSAGEVGDLLDACAPLWENDGERYYELSAEEYAALLEGLERTGKLPETGEEVVAVIVTGPFE